MNALYDAILPPIGYWVLYSTLLYISLSIYSYVTATDIWGIPGLGIAFTLIAAMYMAATFIGLIAFLFLLLPGIVFIIYIVQSKNYSELNVAIKFFHGIAIAGLVGLVSLSIYTHQTRTYADFILDWENTYQAKRQIRLLNEQGATRLEELRIVILHGNERTVAIASDGLAEHGVPSIDVPILIDAYERLQINSAASSELQNVEANLSKLSSLRLPEESSPETWRELWATAQIGENRDESTVYYEVD